VRKMIYHLRKMAAHCKKIYSPCILDIFDNIHYNIIMPRQFIIKTILLLLPVFLLSTISPAQTKTEQAKEQLEEEATEDDSNDEDTERYYDDEDNSSCLGAIFESIFDAVIKEIFCMVFNIPSFESGFGIPAQPACYHRHPFVEENNNSFRTRLSGDNFRYQTDITLGNNFSDGLDALTWRNVFHLYSWSLRLKYKYLNEQNAPYPIHLFSGLIERKSRVLPHLDMGFSAGIEELHIDGSRYSGFAMGYNFEWFISNPTSLFYNPTVMFYGNKLVSSGTFSVNVHKWNYYIGIGGDFLKIAGVDFKTFHIKVGAYF